MRENVNRGKFEGQETLTKRNVHRLTSVILNVNKRQLLIEECLVESERRSLYIECVLKWHIAVFTREFQFQSGVIFAMPYGVALIRYEIC